MATVQFKPLEDLSIHYKGKYVRFAGKFASKRTSYSNQNFVLQPGAVGFCYAASLGVLHVGFQSVKPGILPDKNAVNWTNWPYHIGVSPFEESCWEIES